MLPINIDHVRVPPIKCQGIKTKLINFITTSIEWNGEGRWIEPFLGSGSVVFNIQPKQALIADNNPHIIRFYQDVQNGEITPEQIREYLYTQGELLSQTGDGKDSYFYEVRNRFNTNPNSLDFLFLSRSCFNGMMRFNKKGGFNVPFCRKPDRFRQAYITKIVNQVIWIKSVMEGKEWTFVNQDWRNTLSNVLPTDFVYLDPPYVGKHTDYFNQWTEEDGLELANITQKLQCGYALSMWADNAYRQNDYLDLWNGEIVTQSHFYHVGANVENRNEVNEALVIKPGFVYSGSIEDIPTRLRHRENTIDDNENDNDNDQDINEQLVLL
ncbi:DNA adenine methylase [Lysinibacillus capsici]|uniref:DNA adenine methylase n=1 Tax=Lysinibacillus capsici TaxID=2115968 RepID=UPI001CD9C609|nr:Dam family site-specific DNA-(adenine-N6)-methyltransferase [Lysinibacillus capsici]